jgi:hypothetical protein
VILTYYYLMILCTKGIPCVARLFQAPNVAVIPWNPLLMQTRFPICVPTPCILLAVRQAHKSTIPSPAAAAAMVATSSPFCYIFCRPQVDRTGNNEG